MTEAKAKKAPAKKAAAGKTVTIEQTGSPIGRTPDQEATLKGLAGKLGCKTGDLVHPARVAVSGRAVGPSLYHMLEVMGKDRVLSRFERTNVLLVEQSGAPS